MIIDDIEFDDATLEKVLGKDNPDRWGNPRQKLNRWMSGDESGREITQNKDELYITVNNTGVLPKIELGRIDRNGNWCTVKNITCECIDAIIDYITVSSDPNSKKKELQIENPEEKKRYKLVLQEI